MNKSYLLDNEEMRTRTDIPDWVAKEFEIFSNVVLEPTFPCYFGLTALKKNELRYSFLSHNDWSHLPHTMLSFLELMKERPIVRRGFFLFIEPECEEQSLEYYRDSFWKVLQYLHENDDLALPKQIP